MQHEFDAVIAEFDATTRTRVQTASTSTSTYIRAWADFVDHGGPDTDRCRTARCGGGPAAPRSTEMLASMAAHVGPLSPTGTRNDVRSRLM